MLEDLHGPAALLLGGHEREADVALARGAEERSRRDEDAVLEQARREALRRLAGGVATQRYIVAGPPASRSPIAGEQVEEQLALARRRAARARSTCSSSPQATTEARCTNSCGAVPTFGRNCFSAAISSGSPATNPER